MVNARQYAIGLLLFGIVEVFLSPGQAADDYNCNKLVGCDGVAESSHDDQKREIRSVADTELASHREDKRKKRDSLFVQLPIMPFSKVMEPFTPPIMTNAYDALHNLATPMAAIVDELQKFAKGIIKNNLATNNCILNKISASQIRNFITRINNIQNECRTSRASDPTEATPEKSDDETTDAKPSAE